MNDKTALLTDSELDERLAERPAPRVTKEGIESRIVRVQYFILPETTVTVCSLTLDNGYSIRGESACVNTANFDKEIGERFAYDDAFRRLWPLFGFLLAEDQFRAQQLPSVATTWQERVAREQRDLGEKLEKLSAFLHGDQLDDLDEDEIDRLKRQLVHMTEYSAVLGERIEAFARP
mgnify:FL=1